MKTFSFLKIYHKPKSLSHHQAASLPYAGLTAWSALSLTAQLSLSDSQKPKNVLVIGASGGVGTIAVQLLKIWNCKVRYLVFKFRIRNIKIRAIHIPLILLLNYLLGSGYSYLPRWCLWDGQRFRSRCRPGL